MIVEFDIYLGQLLINQYHSLEGRQHIDMHLNKDLFKTRTKIFQNNLCLEKDFILNKNISENLISKYKSDLKSLSRTLEVIHNFMKILRLHNVDI